MAGTVVDEGMICLAKRSSVSALVAIPIWLSRRNPACPLRATANKVKIALKRVVFDHAQGPPLEVVQQTFFHNLDTQRSEL